MGELIMTSLPAIDSQQTLFDELQREYIYDRMLVFNADVDENMIEDIIMWIIKWNKDDKDLPVDKRKKIKLFMTSPGGSPFTANIVADVILQSKTPVIGIGFDVVASAAYTVYLACHERYAFKNSVFLQHEGDISLENSRSKFKQTANFFDSLEQRSKEFILDRTTMSEEYYDKSYEQELWMTSKEAMDLGIVHKIIGEDISLEEIL